VKRDRLGKGLGALLGEYLGEEGTGRDTPAGGLQARSILVSSIRPNPYQPRREFAEDELADLAASLKANGLLQPIVVRPAGGAMAAGAAAGADSAASTDARTDVRSSGTGKTGTDLTAGATGSRVAGRSNLAGQWELVAGERRWRAAMRLGWTEITAVIRDVDDRTLLVLALVENLQRSQLSALEEAEGYERLAAEFTLTQQQVADVVGKDRSTVANALRLLQLPHSVRQLLREGALTAGHARALLGLDNDHRIIEVGRQAATESWSVRDVEAHVKRARTPVRQGAPKQKAREAAERMLEDELQRRFGTDARIRHSRGNRGRIEIPFLGAEDFERIFELLTGQSATDVVS
jgi:ParB family transcriptional regulator, chromosome partitioning protein